MVKWGPFNHDAIINSTNALPFPLSFQYAFFWRVSGSPAGALHRTAGRVRTTRGSRRLSTQHNKHSRAPRNFPQYVHHSTALQSAQNNKNRNIGQRKPTQNAVNERRAARGGTAPAEALYSKIFTSLAEIWLLLGHAQL